MTSDVASQLTVTQSVAYAVLCAQETEGDTAWQAWAKRWLSGADRAAVSADRARQAAKTEAARHAAEAARLLGEATQRQTEAALLAAEGRNARWQLDEAGSLEGSCLQAVASAVRTAAVTDVRRILDLAERDY